jgi:spore coat protein U-like protein
VKSAASKTLQTVAALGALVSAFAAPAHAAGNATDTFDVTATVIATCNIDAQDLQFNNYNPINAAALDAQTTISLTCTNGTPYALSLNLGNGSGASTATRFMTSAANNKLSYILYRDAGRTQLWGQTAGSDTLAGTGTGTAATVNVYGRVPMQQTLPAGSYTDTITVTVAW